MIPHSFDQSLKKLIDYIESQQYRGYDPYDTLNSIIPLAKLGKWPPILATQVMKRLPINIRPLLGIKKGINPKAMGLLLQAYSNLYRLESSPELAAKMRYLFEWLIQRTSEGYSGACWGYNFDWASPVKTVKAYTPSVVVSGFIAKGIYAYYLALGDERALEVLQSIRSFVLNDLPRTETDDGICISYTPVMKDCCYNASLLGAEILAMEAKVSENENNINLCRRAVEFVIAHQKKDGRWNYSIDVSTGQERKQIDFHQGFVLESIYNIKNLLGVDKDWDESLSRGLAFYKTEQFFSDGRSKWRLPKEWPVEIHNQAQGIITFALLQDYSTENADFAGTIASWTIKNMQSRTGYFYYRKLPIYTNRIPYMRWSQAWMMLALSNLETK